MEYDPYDRSYESCEGCNRRKVGCHNEEYCKGWGFREQEKQKRYAATEARINGRPVIQPYQMRLMRKNMMQEKKK